jgi:5-formyltetrahydrofolate cyclo-ligase
MPFPTDEAHLALRNRKRELRKAAIDRRDALSADERREAGRVITQTALAMAEYREARAVMSYCGFGSELDTGPFNDAVLPSGKRLVLPKIDRATGRLAIYGVADPETDLVAGVWGIREPDPARCARAALADVDYVFVPGAAFDRRCGRIGYGKGYYDQLLASFAAAGRDPWRVAGCFAVQVVESVPMESFDVPMHALLTELESLRAAPESVTASLCGS